MTRGVSTVQTITLRLLLGALTVMARISDYVLFPLISAFRHGLWKATIPPINDRLLLMSATEIADKIRSREVTMDCGEGDSF